MIVFAPMMMAKRAVKGKEFFKKAGGTIFWSYTSACAQYAIPLLLTAFVLIPLFGVDPLFGVIVEEGWAGGHGTAGGMSLVFEELNWADGQSLAITSATFGLLFGIIGGIIMINIAVKKGWTALLSKSASLQNTDAEIFTGENRPVDTHSAISNSVIDNFAFHASLIGLAVFLGWLATKALKLYLNISISWFVMAMFAGLLVQKILNKTPWGDAVDKATLGRIQGTCLEFLIAGAVASVNVPIVLEYAWPLLIQQTLMLAVILFMTLWFARRVIGEYWFENAMVLYGSYTGVVATGLMLLKTCDPDMKSDAMELLAARSPFTSWAIAGGIMTSMTPYWVVQYGIYKVGFSYLAAMLIFMLLPRLCGFWNPKRDTATSSTKIS